MQNTFLKYLLAIFVTTGVCILIITISWNKPPAYIPIPSGIIEAYGGTSAPSGYVLCDGSAINRTTNAALFSAIGTAYGTGDGSTTFNVPDLRQRFVLGKATSGTGSTLGGTGGTIDHDHGSPITSGTPSTTVAATNLTGTAASTTHTHSVTLTAQNPPFQTANYIIKL